MNRSVIVTTPIPSLEEVGASLGLSKARQKALMQIIMSTDSGHSTAGKRANGTDYRRKRKSIKAGTGRREVAAKRR
jgi:hypothetical protein